MLRFTPHGAIEMIVGSLLLAGIGVGLWFVWPPLLLLVVVIWLWLMAFFRDPERPITPDARAMVSPADGLVSDVTELENCDLVGGPAVRIGIFLSVFNVHVNRSPCDGEVSSVVYKKGKFINALSHAQASSDNESNTLVLVEPGTKSPVAAVKQIVGLIARRIICTPRVGQVVGRGERIGMIKFGSRTELYIPRRLEPEVKVTPGTKVRGGLDILAVVNRPITSGVATDATAQQSCPGNSAPGAAT